MTTYVDPYELLKELLPDFIFNLPLSDINSYIKNSFVSRRFVLRGRFRPFGHTRIMQTFEETLLDSFLKDCVLRQRSEAIYEGDTVGSKSYK
jgi:hypothetical protein